MIKVKGVVMSISLCSLLEKVLVIVMSTVGSESVQN